MIITLFDTFYQQQKEKERNDSNICLFFHCAPVKPAGTSLKYLSPSIPLNWRMSLKGSWMQWKSSRVSTEALPVSPDQCDSVIICVFLCFPEVCLTDFDHSLFSFQTVSSSMIELSVVEIAVQDCTQSCDESM